MCPRVHNRQPTKQFNRISLEKAKTIFFWVLIGGSEFFLAFCLINHCLGEAKRNFRYFWYQNFKILTFWSKTLTFVNENYIFGGQFSILGIGLRSWFSAATRFFKRKYVENMYTFRVLIGGNDFFLYKFIVGEVKVKNDRKFLEFPIRSSTEASSTFGDLWPYKVWNSRTH